MSSQAPGGGRGGAAWGDEGSAQVFPLAGAPPMRLRPHAVGVGSSAWLPCAGLGLQTRHVPFPMASQLLPGLAGSGPSPRSLPGAPALGTMGTGLLPAPHPSTTGGTPPDRKKVRLGRFSQRVQRVFAGAQRPGAWWEAAAPPLTAVGRQLTCPPAGLWLLNVMASGATTSPPSCLKGLRAVGQAAPPPGPPWVSSGHILSRAASRSDVGGMWGAGSAL